MNTRRTTHSFMKSVIGLFVFLIGLGVRGVYADVRVLPGNKITSRSTATRSMRMPRSLPLSFEPNAGQTSAYVRYLSLGPGYELLLTNTSAILSIGNGCRSSSFLSTVSAATRKRFGAGKIGRALLRHYKRCGNTSVQMFFDAANHRARLEAINELPAKSNFFIGPDRSKWRVGIPNYARIQYREIYPGVNLVFHGNRGDLEFDFVVSPGADPNRIALQFAQRENPRVGVGGDLRLGHRSALVLHRPLIYQIEGGRRRTVRGGFAVLNSGRVAFRIGEYDHREPLIIDPTLSYSTYLDGVSGDSDGDGIAVDSSGDAYIVGTTFSPTFPTVNGYQTAAGAAGNGIVFVAELNPTGTQLLYSTYLGGTGGDYGTGIAIDGSGNAYVTGYTFSTDFPVVNGFQTTNNNTAGGNAFVARIDTTKTGATSLAYSTYLGGGGNPSNPNPWYGDTGYGIAADSSGRAYVTGDTTSDTSVAAFPTTTSAYQSALNSIDGNAFLTVVDTTQSGSSSLTYSTYLGGDGAGPFGDFGIGVADDTAGDAYLVGQTTSNASDPFPTTSSAYQPSLNSSNGNAFLTEIATTQAGLQSLVYSTYIGGSLSGSPGDMGISVALDSAGKAYVTGSATTSDFPTTIGAYQTTNSANGKAFVAKFDTTQIGVASLVYSTLLGGGTGTMGDWTNGIAVDGNGDAFVAGQTSSTDFPTTSNAYQSSLRSSGGWNAFLTELDPTGANLVYSTFLGGSSSFGDVATGVALDSLSNAYMVGYTESSDFPTTAGAFQTTLNGSQSAFVAEMDSPNGATLAVTASPTSATILSGQSASYTLSLRSQGSFTSPISFACYGLPKFAACRFSPSYLIPSTGTVETQLTISTGGSGSSSWDPLLRVGGGDWRFYILGVSLWLLAISALVLGGIKKSQRRLSFVLAATFAVAGVVGCASSQAASSTPSGTSDVTVAASGQTAVGITTNTVSIELTVK